MSEIVSVEAAAPLPPAEIVPAEIALPPPPRLHPRPLMKLVGLPGLWLFPKKFGAHLAAGSLWAAVLACSVGLCVELALLIVWQAGRLDEDLVQPDLPLFEKCRVVIAEFAIDAAVDSGSALEALIVAAAFALEPVGLAVILWLAMPVWIAAGDSSRSVYRRSLRLGLWLTTTGIPVALLFVFVLPVLTDVPSLRRGPANSLTVIVGAALAVWIMLRAGLRYAGPPVGPGFDPVEPRCNECGYALQGLPTTGRCPECGESVARSLARYTEPQAVPRALHRWGRRVMMIPRTLFKPSATFRGLRIQFDAPEARRFWIMNMLLIGAVFIAYGAILAYMHGRPFDWETFTVAFIVTLLIGIGSQAILAMIYTLGALLRRGQRRLDIRITTIALGYASSMLWPAAVWILAFLIAFEQVDGVSELERPFLLPVLEIETAVSELIWLGASLVLVVLLGLWAWWIDKGYRNLRHTAG